MDIRSPRILAGESLDGDSFEVALVGPLAPWRDIRGRRNGETESRLERHRPSAVARRKVSFGTLRRHSIAGMVDPVDVAGRWRMRTCHHRLCNFGHFGFSRDATPAANGFADFWVHEKTKEESRNDRILVSGSSRITLTFDQDSTPAPDRFFQETIIQLGSGHPLRKRGWKESGKWR